MTDSKEKETRTLKSGAIMDTETGRLVGHTGEGPYTFNSETGRAAALSRWENQREAFARGFARGLGEVGKAHGDAAAWEATGEYVGRAISKAADTNTRGLAELVRMAGEFTGNVPGKLDTALLVEKQGYSEYGLFIQSIAPLARILDLIEGKSQREKTQGQVIDAE